VFGDHRLSPLARALLAGEREHAENEALKAQALERARAALERPSGVGLRSELPPALPGRRAPRMYWVAAAAIAAIAGISAAAGINAHGSGDTGPPRRLRALAPLVVPRAEVPASSPSAPQPALVEETPAIPARAASAGGGGARSTAPRSYAAEVALLEPARRGISQGDYAGALSALAKHRREYPSGQLVEEREALRVRALWGLGQKGTALSAAKAFRKRYPRSALLSWLGDQGDSAP
jgi:hypothetical protein